MGAIFVSDYTDSDIRYVLGHRYRSNWQAKSTLIKSKADDTREIGISIDNTIFLVDVSGGPFFWRGRWCQRAFLAKV